MPIPLRRAGALLLAISVAAACEPSVSPTPPATPDPTASTATATPGTASPTPLSSEDLASVYREVNDQVRAIRGLDEEERVEPQFVSPDDLAAILEDNVREDSPPELLAAYERLYHAMGLLPEDRALDEVYVDLLESQVAGLYDPTEDSLYVRSSGGVGPVEKVLYAHEYVHALQDQNFDLEAFLPAEMVDETDQQLARLAVVEGDAYTAMTQWLQGHLAPAELLQFIAESQDPEALEALARTPPIVAAQITFPAAQGFIWVLGVQAAGGWEAVDELFANPPTTTEQIIHPDKLASREPAIDVEIPPDLAETLGSGWSVGLEDTMGEAQIAVWLSGTVGDGGLPPPPPAGAAGWGGDRLVLLDGPDDARAVVMKTEWDSAADAAEFEAAVAAVLDDAPGQAGVLPGEGGAVRWILFASDAATLGAVAGALGLAG